MQLFPDTEKYPEIERLFIEQLRAIDSDVSIS